MPDDATERWRAVVGWEGVYEVSDQGRLRRIRRGRRSRAQPGTPLRPGPTGHGYLGLVLKDTPRHQAVSVHQAVMRAFVGPPPPGYTVDHINKDKTDNRLANLRYLTPKEQVAHSRAEIDARLPRGELSRAAVLTDSHVRAIRAAAAAQITSTVLARRYGVAFKTVRDVIRRRSWKHVP